MSIYVFKSKVRIVLNFLKEHPLGKNTRIIDEVYVVIKIQIYRNKTTFLIFL